MVCHITGTLYLSDGTACGNASLTVTRNPLIPAAQNGGVVMTAPRSFLSDGAGAVAFDLLAGQYLCDLTFATVKRQFVMNVPEAPSAPIMACVEAAGVPLTAASTAAAQAAAAEALVSANAAAVSAAAAQSALHVAYPSLAVAQASTPPATALYVSVTDGGVVTRYVADKSGTLTLADGSKWAKAEDPAGAVSFRLAAAIGPDEAQAAIGLRAERVTFSTAGRTHVVNANDYEPVNHLILLSEAKTSLNVDLSGLPLQRKFFFANGSTVLGAMAYFDCGSDVYLTGTITAATVVNNRTFVLPPGFAARVERLGGTLTLVEIIPKAAYGTVTYNWVHKPDGTYRVTYVRPKSLAFAPGAETGVLGLSSFQSLDSATVISITMGPRDDGGPVPPNPVVVSKMGSVTGLNPWEFKLRNTSASILTCDICIVFDGVTEV